MEELLEEQARQFAKDVDDLMNPNFDGRSTHDLVREAGPSRLRRIPNGNGLDARLGTPARHGNGDGLLHFHTTPTQLNRGSTAESSPIEDDPGHDVDSTDERPVRSSAFDNSYGLGRPGRERENERTGRGSGSIKLEVDETERKARDAFRSLKPICVPLLGTSRIDSTNRSQSLILLKRLHATLLSLPPSTFHPSLLQYVLFPLVQVLKRNDPLNRANLPDNHLEYLFGCLSIIVDTWKRTSDGIDIAHWEQFWVLSILVLGGPVDGKGKSRELSEETESAALNLLHSLLDQLDGGWVVHPTSKHLSHLFASQLLQPILIHTISTLIRADARSRPIQASRLSLLLSLLDTYLIRRDKIEILASVLPGIVSSMTKLLRSTRTGSQASIIALEIVQTAVVGTLHDDVLVRRGITRKVTSLEDLMQDSTSDQKDADSTRTSESGAFPAITAQYVAFTSTQLNTTLRAILPFVSTRDATDVRRATAELCGEILTQCKEAMSSSRDLLLATLLQLGRDPFPQVSSTASHYLSTDMDCSSLLSMQMNSFPSAILSSTADEDKARRIARTITAIADIYPAAFRDLLGPVGGIQRWGWHLLSCLELTWKAETSMGAIEGPGPHQRSFPDIPLRHVESRELSREVVCMLESIGRASSKNGSAAFAIQFLLSVIRSKRSGRDTAIATSAMWVIERLIRGTSDGETAKQVAKAIIALEDDEDDESDHQTPDADDQQDTTGSTSVVTRRPGMQDISLLQHDARTPAKEARRTRRIHSQLQMRIFSALSLSTLTACAEVLGSSFRPLLLNALYVLLSRISIPALRGHALIALERVAYACAYASTTNMILANVDYVVNVVSQRLVYRRLSPLAPMVLVSMIELVGRPIVPMVSDIVEEVFDALDDYHGYEMLCGAMLAVLAAVMRAIGADGYGHADAEENVTLCEHSGKSETTANDSNRRSGDKTRGKPPPSEMDQLRSWWNEKLKLREELEAEKQEDQTRDRYDTAPPIPWEQLKKSNEEDTESKAQPDTTDPEDIPPTRTQAVCHSILTRSIPFLTHSSPFLRARVLDMLAQGLPAARHEDLLPSVHLAWPYVINRLKDPEWFVVASACETVRSMARWTGDYLSRKVMDDAWPAFKSILQVRQRTDLISSGVSKRLYEAILGTLIQVVHDVPIQPKTLWDIGVRMRPFLFGIDVEEAKTKVSGPARPRSHYKKTANELRDLQDLGITLYQLLAGKDSDAIWILLRCSTGQDGAEVFAYLQQPEWSNSQSQMVAQAVFER